MLDRSYLGFVFVQFKLVLRSMGKTFDLTLKQSSHNETIPAINQNIIKFFYGQMIFIFRK